jgi:hypothetical protein
LKAVYITLSVMAGLDPAIHVSFAMRGKKDVDARDKPGHDGETGQEIISSLVLGGS